MEEAYRLPMTRDAGAVMPAANVGSTERLVNVAAGAALLGYAWRNRSRKAGLASAGLLLRGATGYCPGYAALGINHSDTRQSLSGPRGVHIREGITIKATPEQVYRFWRRLDRLPEVMPHLDRVEVLDATRSRWTAKAFDQVPVSWVAEIINDVRGETIGWKTLPGEMIQHAGSVTFKPSRAFGETEVHVHLQYAAPGGKAADWLARLTGEDPARQVRDGLAALKRQLDGLPPHNTSTTTP
jgi:uncharacterized membrane protein